MLHCSFNRVTAKSVVARAGCASLALALFAAVAPAEAQFEQRPYQKGVKARAAAERQARPAAERATRPAAERPKALSADGPLLMLVSLNQQRMFVYDSNGLVVQTAISSGRPGHETPKGIYSILEKKVDHTSNIYLDAKMPHMQRLTMTGIALHGGVIPGYAASGGCVRLPFDFARRFFDLTDLNQRVVIAPDVQSPIGFEHPLLFSALPSAADAGVPGERADTSSALKAGIDVAGAVLGVTSAHASTEPQGRTLESAAEARTAERQRLVDAIGQAGERRTKAAEAEKAAGVAIVETRKAAKAAWGTAGAASREASKAKAALAQQDRALKKIQAQLAKDNSKMRADKLEELRAAASAEEARIAPATEEAQRTADAAKSQTDAAKAADKDAADAIAALKAAKAEIKDAAQAEIAAKKAVASFDRQEQNRALPVSVFVSSATGKVLVRQGFEHVIEAQATIANPEQPLDTFIFTASGWKDDRKTDLVWTATEVNEYETRISTLDGDDPRRNKRKAKEIKMPVPTDAAKAQRTLDRIQLPKAVNERIAEVMKPGSTLIVSSYDISHSEMKYPGTDFVVQMPEVVAKITKPTPRPRPVEVVEDSGSGSGGCFFFCSSNSSSKPVKERKRQRASSKSTVW